jgi:predicted O-linked N-acetylglucosamine transferase (SPINDLY family)
VKESPLSKSGEIVFASFNNSSKVTRNVISVWSQILKQIPNAYLVVKSKQLTDESTRKRYYEMFLQNGVSAERVKIMSRLSSRDEHLNLYNQVDIALDPFPYNGTTTTCEALWMGIPVVTLRGERHVGRVGTSILTRVGLTDLIAETEADYIAKAVQLAGNTNRLRELRFTLRGVMQNSLLCNAKAFAQSVETAYREMWMRYLKSDQVSGFRFQVSSSDEESRRDVSDANTPLPPPQGGILPPHSPFEGGRGDVSGVEIPLSPPLQKGEIRNPPFPKGGQGGFSDNAEGCYNKGNLLRDQGKTDEAIACYQKALKLNPNYAEAYNNMGNMLRDQGRIREAMESYTKAIQIAPKYVQAYNNMGIALEDQSRVEDAILCYREALKIAPDYEQAYSNLVPQLQQICDWREYKEFTRKLDELTDAALRSGKRAIEDPFTNLTRHEDPARNLAVAKSWVRDIVKPLAGLNMNFSFEQRKSKTKITLGYISKDFRNHPVAHLMLALFGLHNRDEFEVFCYSYGTDDGSEYRERIKQDSDKFVDIHHLGYADAAKCIYADKVDILIDLMGFTGGSRLGIPALRPAPIQANYLGFPGTVGADFFDYIITDRIVTPESHSIYYTEKFVCLPDCFQINDNTQMISDKDWRSADAGLPENGFVFCSFNQPYKIEPVMFNVWMNILRRVPESVLWLSKSSETVQRNLRREAQAAGIAPERLVFAEKLPSKADHLARHRLAGIALDTRIYNGHTTTSDALWSGVPVITLQGGHYASRASSSILNAVGLPELIAHSLEEYEYLAARLATHPDALREIRLKLAKHRVTKPLFNTLRFIRNIEKAYSEMWKRFAKGEKPEPIEVKV